MKVKSSQWKKKKKYFRETNSAVFCVIHQTSIKPPSLLSNSVINPFLNQSSHQIMKMGGISVDGEILLPLSVSLKQNLFFHIFGKPLRRLFKKLLIEMQKFKKGECKKEKIFYWEGVILLILNTQFISTLSPFFRISDIGSFYENTFRRFSRNLNLTSINKSINLFKLSIITQHLNLISTF